MRLQDLRHPTLKARELNASALARGSLAAPALELLANLTGVTSNERTWSRVRVSANGTAEQLAVKAQAWGDKPDLVELSAMVFPSSEQIVRSPEVRVEDASGDLLIRAAGVTLAGEAVQVERLTLEGPGGPSYLCRMVRASSGSICAPSSSTPRPSSKSWASRRPFAAGSSTSPRSSRTASNRAARSCSTSMTSRLAS